MKWMNKLLIHSINLAGHRKSACCLQVLEIRVIAPLRHWRSQVFPQGCCHHDLKVFCETGYNKYTFEYFTKYEVKMTRILFITYPSCETALKNGRVRSKIVRKSSLNFTFGQGSCLISDFARPNSIT